MGLEMNLLTGGIITQFALELTDPQVLHVEVDLRSKFGKKWRITNIKLTTRLHVAVTGADVFAVGAPPSPVLRQLLDLGVRIPEGGVVGRRGPIRVPPHFRLLLRRLGLGGNSASFWFQRHSVDSIEVTGKVANRHNLR